MLIQSLSMLFTCENWSLSGGKRDRKKVYAGYSYSLYQSIDEINADTWNFVLRDKTFFLNVNYLNILEKSKANNLSLRYVIVHEKEEPVMICYFQIIDFTAEIFGSLIAEQFESLQIKKNKLFGKYLQPKKNTTLLRLVTCGNNFVSGEYGFYAADKLKREEQFKLLGAISDALGKEEKLRGRISATLVKDFYTSSLPESAHPLGEKYLPFSVEPNMIIDLPKVNTLGAYVAAFSKKYRNRAKNIFKAASELEFRELDEQEIRKYRNEIFALYLQVFTNAKFKLVCLSPEYFEQMKHIFQHEFRLFAFFEKNKMLSFCTCVLPKHSNFLYGHYLGFDYEKNKELELYQNMLYTLIEVALKENRSKVNLGRTASEIKSTVGAKAHELTCFIKPQNTVSKLILKPFISYLQPSQWVPRNPFKEE